MSWLQVVVLSIVQGLTEFLPISSSGHLAIVSRVFFSGDAGASFTAVSQLGTEAAVLVYFARDIVRILKAWFDGLLVKAHRDNVDYRLGWYVIIGSIPIGVLGVLFKDAIRTEVRNLWVIATAMLVFSSPTTLADDRDDTAKGALRASCRGHIVEPSTAISMYLGAAEKASRMERPSTKRAMPSS